MKSGDTDISHLKFYPGDSYGKPLLTMTTPEQEWYKKYVDDYQGPTNQTIFWV